MNGYFIECFTANLKQIELFSRYGFGKSLVQYFHKKKLKTLKIFYISNKNKLEMKVLLMKSTHELLFFLGTFNNTVKS